MIVYNIENNDLETYPLGWPVILKCIGTRWTEAGICVYIHTAVTIMKNKLIAINKINTL